MTSVRLVRLKKSAKKLKKSLGISHSAALTEIANSQGYSDWRELNDNLRVLDPVEGNGFIAQSFSALRKEALSLEQALLSEKDDDEAVLSKQEKAAIHDTVAKRYGYDTWDHLLMGVESEEKPSPSAELEHASPKIGL